MDEHTPSPAAGEPSAWLPPTPDPTVLAVATTEPRRASRTRLFALIAAAALLIGGVGAFVLLRDDKADAYSLTAAAQSATAAKNVSYDMTIEAAGETITAEAVFDGDSGLMQMTSDLGGVIPGAEAGITIVLDTTSQTMYLDASAFEGFGIPIDTPWISFDASTMSDESGGDPTDLGLSALGNPLDIAALLEQAKSVRDAGYEDLDGERVKHYVVTIDISDVIATNPEVSEQFGGATGDLPDEIEYDVWVNESNELRRLAFTIEVSGESISLDLLVSELDGDVSITLPDPSNVTDLSEMLGG